MKRMAYVNKIYVVKRRTLWWLPANKGLEHYAGFSGDHPL
jgi:hypothetical protein